MVYTPLPKYEPFPAVVNVSEPPLPKFDPNCFKIPKIIRDDPVDDCVVDQRQGMPIVACPDRNKKNHEKRECPFWHGHGYGSCTPVQRAAMLRMFSDMPVGEERARIEATENEQIVELIAKKERELAAINANIANNGYRYDHLQEVRRFEKAEWEMKNDH